MWGEGCGACGQAPYARNVPDLPGCVAAGATVAKVKAALKVAIPFHFEELKAGGETVPAPEGAVECVEVQRA